jgi:hypothetical protein
MGKPSRDRRSPSSGSSSSSLVDQTGSSSRSGVYTGSSSRSEVLTGSSSRSGAYTGSSSRSEVLTGSSSRSHVVPGSDSRSSFRSPSISRSLSRSRSRSRTPLRRVRSQSPITPPLRKRSVRFNFWMYMQLFTFGNSWIELLQYFQLSSRYQVNMSIFVSCVMSSLDASKTMWPAFAYFRVNLTFPFVIIISEHLTNRRLFLVFHTTGNKGKMERIWSHFLIQTYGQL